MISRYHGQSLPPILSLTEEGFFPKYSTGTNTSPDYSHFSNDLRAPRHDGDGRQPLLEFRETESKDEELSVTPIS